MTLQISPKKWTFQVIFWTTALVLGGGLLRNVGRAYAQDHLTDGVSVVLQEVLTRPDGSKMNSAVYHFATNTDGSTVFVPRNTPNSVEEPVRIVELASGLRGYISDVHRQKALRRTTANSARLASAGCILPGAHDRVAGEEQINGYRAEKVVRANSISWYSLDYSCGLLKEHTDWPDGGKSDKYLVMLRAGAPESSLFTAPSDYADVPDTAFLR